jgi:hypothetical protein
LGSDLVPSFFPSNFAAHFEHGAGRVFDVDFIVQIKDD